MKATEVERDQYPNLSADVAILHCTKERPMPIEIADQVVELKQLWIHDDAEETEESKELDSRWMFVRCPNCTHEYGVDLGD